MKLTNYCGLLITCCFVAVFADVSISGKVTNARDGNALADVKLWLTNSEHDSTHSDQNGNFTLISESSNAKADASRRLQTAPIRIEGSRLKFPSFPVGRSFYIKIFSTKGKLLFQKAAAIRDDNSSIRLPQLSSGHHILRVELDALSHTVGFLSLNNEYMLTQNSLHINRQAESVMAKRTEAIDTLVASKAGYDTVKVAVSSYTEQDITITMDSAATNRGLTIYFIRHAETLANALGQHGGEGDAANHDTLTVLGLRQVEELKEYLSDEQITPDLIAVSPTIRTQKTIDPFLEETGLNARIWVELNECCGGEPTGEPLPTQRDEPVWKMNVETISDNFSFPTEEDTYYWWPETYEEGLFMVMTARDRILDNFSQSGKTLMIIGHAVNGNTLLGLLRGYDMLENQPQRGVYLMNTAVNILTQDTVTGEFSLEQNIHMPPME